MSRADQERIVTVMREGGLEARWSIARLSTAAGLPKADVVRAVQSLRFAGKMEFNAYRLMPSQFATNEEVPERASDDACAGRTGGASIAADARAEAGADRAGTPPSSAPAEAQADVPMSVPEYPDIRAEVAAEARESVRSRSAARTLSSTPSKRKGYVNAPLPPAQGLTLGGVVQDLALSDDVLAAANALRLRWNGLWRQICLSGVAQAERPIQAMLRLIEAGLAAEQQDIGRNSREDAA